MEHVGLQIDVLYVDMNNIAMSFMEKGDIEESARVLSIAMLDNPNATIPDPTDAGVVVKVTRKKLKAPKEV
jgi:hypothetical protein